MSARDTALDVLIACRTAGAFSDAALKDRIAGLDARDAGLSTTLTYGVLQNRALLDSYIDRFLRGRKRIPPMLRDILRLAVYQICFLSRVPDSAAVNEAVGQAKRRLGPREAGICNGVLRNLLREKESLTPPADYAIRYSHPSELVDLLKASVGKNLQKILAADNERPDTCIQTNPLQCGADDLERALLDAGASVTRHPWMEGCFLIHGAGNLEKLPAFQNGWFQVQDAAARLSVQAMALTPNLRVLDLCAAPGGKSIAAAISMENQGEILACDLRAGKLPQIEAAAGRMGVTIITTRENDAPLLAPELIEGFDAVIADVPCSGLGVIRKKPDIRYKDIPAMEKLPELQRQILENAGRYVRPGGALLYSTCTILKRENEDVVRGFLESHPEFRPEHLRIPDALTEEGPGMLTLYQGIHDCDGFFMCHMRKTV